MGLTAEEDHECRIDAQLVVEYFIFMYIVLRRTFLLYIACKR